MNNTFSSQPQLRAERPNGLPFVDQSGPDGAFWCGAIGAGAAIMVDLTVHIDVLSHSISQLPGNTAASRPAVANYLAMVKALAAAWSTRTRPALSEALDALAHVGVSLGQPFTLEAIANCRIDGSRAAAKVVDGTLRRLAVPAKALAALAHDFDALLASMACATGDLQADTQLVSERLQSDHVHAFLLSQHASSLQSKLDDATVRQDAYWLQGPHAEQIRQEIAMHSAALEGVRRQLDYLHTEQAVTRAEAHYLQKLMPSLAGYLGALERIAGAIRATGAGSSALLAELRELKRLLAEEPHAASDAEAQLRAALPQWRNLVTGTARLRPACSVKTRGATRT